jgi:succinate dehydrogenase / fumarate reductase membrane anchor subunit
MTEIRSMRTALGRARGLGSNHEGVGHWRTQRLTAVLLIPLGLWFVASVIHLIGFDVDPSVFQAWASEHGNALMLILFVVVLFHHTVLGMQVVIEDYVHGPVAKTISLFLSKTILWLLGASSVLAVLHLYLGG